MHHCAMYTKAMDDILCTQQGHSQGGKWVATVLMTRGDACRQLVVEVRRGLLISIIGIASDTIADTFAMKL